ncbi:hypothetical protein ENSA5_69280 [Enhygromyxa salina]|uniref:Lipoprotein n=1 Tax=Enhygromyxa salina TaxID=215803 RepID=A0A2S9XAV3_9BACT|nr:hypothetical protein [Enhygromyxa salina]PRP89985.1 hypothetical protein ENSA5_69280 [Enhygromyxa salina]
MFRSVIITSLVLSLALVTGCDKPPEGTNPPDDGTTADAGKGKDKKKNKNRDKTEDGGGEGGDDSGADDSEDPTKKVCPAETADYPAPYFADTVLIRLPKNVTEDNFIEFTPTFARLSSEVESVSCVEGTPGAMISYMAMTFYEDDTAKDLITLRDETLEVMGYTGHTISEEKQDDKIRFYQGVLDVPGSDAKPEPAKALFQMSAANGMMYAIVYETHPAAWNALKETFYASASKMSFLAP